MITHAVGARHPNIVAGERGVARSGGRASGQHGAVRTYRVVIIGLGRV